MNCKVFSTLRFEKELKRLVKKFPSLKSEFAELINKLQQTPDTGTSLGNNCYTIRIKIASKGKGKSGGGRVITHFYKKDNSVFLLTIYDKSEKESVTQSEVKEIISGLEF